MKAECSTPKLLEKISMKIAREVEKPDKTFSKTISFAVISQCKTAPPFRFFIASNVLGDN